MRGLVFKLLLKACVPLLLVVGAASYATYLKGGDPGAVLARVGGGLSARFADLGGEARSGITAAVDDVVAPAIDTDVRRWTDANGTVHYSNAPDAPVDARIVRVDPSTNVIIALPSPEPLPTAEASDVRTVPAAASPAPDPGATDAMPGIAGLLDAAPANVTPEQAQALLSALQGEL